MIHFQIGALIDNNQTVDSLMKYSTVNLNNVNKIIKNPYISQNYLQKNRDITESRFVFDKIYKKNIIQKIADYIGPQIWNQQLFFSYEFLFTFSCMKLCDSFISKNRIQLSEQRTGNTRMLPFPFPE